VVLFIALLIGDPWHILSALSIMYLLSLPLGWKSYREQERALAAQSVVPDASTPYTPGAPEIAPDDRPARLN
jgi:CDP-diacylglycerol--serine O-phosphatidyltransferase